MYSIEQSKKIIIGKFEEIKELFDNLDIGTSIELANKIRQYLSTKATK